LWVSIALAATLAPAPTQADPPAITNEPKLGDAWHDLNNPIVKLFGGERLDLWSLKSVRPVAPTRVRRTRWVRNPIDNFIAAQLEKAAISPAREADRRVLARRLTFDLTGLPPTPEMMESFLADKRQDAYERYVDQLLDSPRYGEHQARMWLDIVRYSDSNGFDWDEFRPNAWRFRDYVVRSFNADKPLSQFVIEQLAGDELFEGAPQTPLEQDALIATGFLRLGPFDNAAPLFNEQDRSRAELMSDVVETTGSAFLGLTMACCRCHDHKYDPISHSDYYRFRAFFESMTFADELPLNLAGDQQAINESNSRVDDNQAAEERKRTDLFAPVKLRLRAERRTALTVDEQSLLELPLVQQTEPQKEQIAALNARLEPTAEELIDALDDSCKETLNSIDEAVATLQSQRMKFVTGLCMGNSTDDVPPTHVFHLGDHRSPRDEVAAGFLSVLDPNPADLGATGTPPGRGRRLALARWITSPENPLTARVFVNRIWQMHFGRGLVTTPNDFGLAGARPSHPELLDWLAGEFVRRHWSVKQLHRLIVTSATYRQGPREATPAVSNAAGQIEMSRDALFDSQPARRLTAEQLRDALLAISGLLTGKTDGPPIWPDLPEEILNANPAFLDDNALKVKGWYPSAPEEQPARSIFLVQKRAVRVPFMETFDLPENMVSCARRNTSTVASQALTLLNSPLMSQAARAFADRLVKEAGTSPDAQVQQAFRLAFQRPPDAAEAHACRMFLETRTLSELCRVILNLNELLYVE
jgi:hypothetical protein